MGMTDDQDPPAPARSATQILADLVAKRKAAAGAPRGGGRESELAAAARSASKSKPALRK
jgi:hypothetical protein